MYQFKLDKFEGPLDLLLKLIEEEELDISEVSLAKVTEQYLDYLEQAQDLPMGELADFLVVAAKLLLIKSKILLPTIELEEEEGDLEQQLKIYRIFLETSKVIQKIISKKKFAYIRENKKIRDREPIFNPPKSISTLNLKTLFQEVLGNIEPIVKLPQELIKRTVSIQEKINEIKEMILQKSSLSFGTLLSKAESKTEIIVTFLAILELVKRKSVQVAQKDIFDDIYIENPKS
ncbi:MAG: hypothetical protein COY66_05340 [Candidatus Kerfeldbacteria bacterium CG_4_10_14_0_8_um_filter_42_10]|uniref:Segregation and condensation protein A n=1 Tax=Candidatus Kerfeldbacteria bacterium CG_4_10_14_0_8_um_filter_42_10 TaxID=2014248 RepID=A0A2M7RGV2_9BACT|nr:MAG: hypothetical protein COY66_05340 [Candidatus Kerfeldbacteria bacterium CG_4_10_14_0_8_um_filter_42_10]